MKKITCFALVFCFLFALCACSQVEDNTEPTIAIESPATEPISSETATETTVILETLEENTETSSLAPVDFLDITSVWETEENYYGTLYTTNYAFFEDGTCYIVLSYGHEVLDGAVGTYRLDGNLVHFNTSGKYTYKYTYSFDPSTNTFTQVSETGYFISHQKGDQFLMTPDSENTPERIKTLASPYAPISNGGTTFSLSAIDPTKAWIAQVTRQTESYSYHVYYHFVFLDDGTCHVARSNDEVYLEEGGIGTYRIDGDLIHFSIDFFYGTHSECTYRYIAETDSFVQESERGLYSGDAAGNAIIIYEDTRKTPADVLEWFN